MNNITLIVTTIIPNERMDILLVKRANKTFWNTWGLPGGKIKYKEKINNANTREHKEELGVKLLNPVFINYFEFLKPSHAIVFCFVARINKKIIPDLKEIKEYQWFSYNKIRKMKLAPNHISVIKYYFETCKRQNVH